MSEERIYKIVRYRQNGRRRTIRTHVTLEEAQRHCSDPKTSGIRGGVRWFDGYTRMWIESHFTLRAALHGQNILNEHNQRCGRERGYSVYVRKDGSWEIVIPAPDYPRGE